MLHRLLGFLLGIVFSADLNGQDISQHQWKDRLLIIISEKPSNETLIVQLSILNACSTGLSERKLLIYQILPESYRIITASGQEQPWQSNPAFYQQFSTSGDPFEILLVGLDGGIKLRKNDLLRCHELWADIDQMPMRQAEIRRLKESE